MDYRMYSKGAKAGENVVELIWKDLGEQNIKGSKALKFVGFEGKKDTAFRINGHKEETKIPSNGKFITPYSGDYYMSIYSLVFTDEFEGDIYYII